MQGLMYLRLTLNSLCTNGDLELLILLPLLLSAMITSGHPHPWFMGVLNMEPMVSCMPSKHSTH